jgi:hypothetical protein
MWELPWNEGDLVGYASASLGAFGDAAVIDVAVPRMCDALSSLEGVQALNVTLALLAMVFPEGLADEVPAGALTLPQYRVLRTLADHPGAWKIGDATFANFSLMMGRYGLPDSCRAMQAYLETPTQRTSAR